eukprot:9215373-Pyramimonas_sp.AAC.1
MANRDLGWYYSSAFLLRTDLGDHLDSRVCSPLAIRDLARESAVRRLWNQWALRPDRDRSTVLGPKSPGGYWLEPIISVL